MRAATALQPFANFMREQDEKEAPELLASLEPYRRHVAALGIDPAETDHTPRKFVRHFRKAGSMRLRLVAHTGVEGPPEDIEEAVDLLQVDRLPNAPFAC
jgi:adenine deaminase